MPGRRRLHDQAVQPSGLGLARGARCQQDPRIKTGAPPAFFCLDIDNFKAFNDNYGCLNGDNAIKQAAALFSLKAGPAVLRANVFTRNSGYCK